VHHPDPHIAELEKELLEEINNTGIGPQGLGGTNTALWVPIETFACHITALPVAVNIQCHAARKKTAVI
jgi:fumarate hydratase subunit alpha